MFDSVESLILDLIEWVASRDRTYAETLDAWRTSCPRLAVWEEANDRGLLESEVVNSRTLVRPTVASLSLLRERRPQSYAELRCAAAQPGR
jgi:hypothetical protein